MNALGKGASPQLIAADVRRIGGGANLGVIGIRMAAPSTRLLSNGPPNGASEPMIDGFGRRLTYVRMSITDRCDLRCRYCMPGRMTFAPKTDVLTFDEIVELADIFIARGVRRIRLTGGEPLVRPGVEHLISKLGHRVGNGLDELTLTTNGMRLARFARDLRASGLRRVNVSLDSRDPDRFRYITRHGDLSEVLQGIATADEAGLKIKINMVALKGVNDDEIASMLRWCGAQGYDLTLIETMPLGDVEDDRTSYYLPLSAVQTRLEEEFILLPSQARTGGPARYHEVDGLGMRLGWITPLTQNFCAACNRVRVTATGTAFGCLGQEQRVDLRDVLRSGGAQAVHQALEMLVAGKPKGHDFRIEGGRPAVPRHMNVTGG